MSPTVQNEKFRDRAIRRLNFSSRFASFFFITRGYLSLFNATSRGSAHSIGDDKCVIGRFSWSASVKCWAAIHFSLPRNLKILKPVAATRNIPVTLRYIFRIVRVSITILETWRINKNNLLSMEMFSRERATFRTRRVSLKSRSQILNKILRLSYNEDSRFYQSKIVNIERSVWTVKVFENIRTWQLQLLKRLYDGNNTWLHTRLIKRN